MRYQPSRRWARHPSLIAIIDDYHITSKCFSSISDNTDTIFQACSISKPIAGYAVIHLMQQLVFEPLGMTRPVIYPSGRREQSGVIVHDGPDAGHRSVPHVSGKSGCRVVDDAHRSTQARPSNSEVLGRQRLSPGRIWASETGIGTGDVDAGR